MELADLHWLVVDFDSVERLSCLRCASWLGEDDGANTTALTSGTVSEENLLDRANALAEVILWRNKVRTGR